jgi:hypothetical protein
MEFREKKQKEVLKRMNLKIDADEVHLSQVLELKKLFRSHSGSTPVHLEFWSRQRKLGAVVVDAAWGVSLEQGIEEKIRKIPGVTSVLLTEL